ncbi:fimbria/pilus outer membrane usher protein [Cronobacter dublinensis]
MSLNNARRMKKNRIRHLALLIALQCLSLGLSTGQAWGDDYFNPALLDDGEQTEERPDLSLYEKGPGLAPGKYHVDILINNQNIGNRDVTFFLDKDASGNAVLAPCLSISALKSAGVATEKFRELTERNGCATLGAIPAASATFIANRQQLLLSIPQSAMSQMARGAIPPEEFDEGITALLLNYSYSGSQIKPQEQGREESENDYLNLRPGFNIGAWRLRNYSTWSRSRNGAQMEADFSPVYTYLQRDLRQIGSELVLGQSSSPADVFDSISFTGIQIASDDDMLPDSERGYAPVVRGIANSNALITIRQNGYMIYQNTVAPGAFEIRDIYPSGSSGDLSVTVKETDGSEQHFVVPYASVPVLQREGRLKYSLTGGKYRAYDEDVAQTPFIQSAAIYGMRDGFTAYGGVQYSPYYRALALGAGKNLGDWGALSVDVTSAKSQPFRGEAQNGRSWRVRYSKNIASTNTTLAVAGYRYNSDGFYTLQENMDSYRRDDLWDTSDRRRSRQEITLNQNLGDALGSLNLSLIKEKYWDNAQTQTSIGAGYSNSWHGISFGFNYSLNENTQALDDSRAAKNHEQRFSLSVSVPLDGWMSNTWASYSLNNSEEGSVQTLGLNGAALADNNLNWGIQQSISRDGNNNATTLNADYRGTYGELSAGYSQDHTQRQINYGVSGGIIAHRHGVTLGQPLGETLALVEVPGVSGTAIANQNGIKTDFRGYAIVPNTSPWRRNSITLDTETLPDGADVTYAAKTVTPTRGAVVRARFDAHVGNRVLMTLLRADGRPVPFGASVANGEQSDASIVGDNGQVYLTGLQPGALLTASWGNAANQHCSAHYPLPEKSQGSAIITVTAPCS